MLQACLNGGRTKSENPSVPVSHGELAKDALAVRAAGAESLHVHPRNAAGAETLDPDEVGRCIKAIREKVSGMPVGVGTGAWIEPRSAIRLDHIRAWGVLPDYASVNLNEADAADTIEILLSKGVGIEAGVWIAEDAQRLAAMRIAGSCLRILIEMNSEDPTDAEREYRATRAVLDQARIEVPVLLHGAGGSVWPMVGLAALNGHDTRVGFEDGLALPDGTPAGSNADLVRAAADILRDGA